ncbi:MAG: hypothetical protein HY699_07705 [Deltaproteobacteria bacterium]|nr:hypothetical protein [Deltaproteobacteria bacterium]
MISEIQAASARANFARYRPGQHGGHYESFFVRANHPSRPLAFWIRYTIFSPDRRPELAIGELWAVAFDGESSEHVAVKSEVPLSHCLFDRDKFAVRIAGALLEPGRLSGGAASGGHTLSWDLDFGGATEPLFLFPLKLYDTRLPKAKTLVPAPLAVFSGTLTVDGRTLAVDDWIGSQNHNWGSQHTDHYAWGQVAGFDDAPGDFLELGTARLKFGPFWTPFMTTLVLRHRGQEIALNSLRQTLRARASFGYFSWQFHSATAAVEVEGSIHAPRESFVGLRYLNPPGGSKHCLNSKLAACELRLTDKLAGATEVLHCRQRAAFEILTGDSDHGVAISA